jgi:hypothetical protein
MKKKSPNQRKALLRIGAQHPAWSSNPNDALVRIFNDITKIAREAVDAKGKSDNQKADWCSRELEKELEKVDVDNVKGMIKEVLEKTFYCPWCGVVKPISCQCSKGYCRTCSSSDC